MPRGDSCQLLAQMRQYRCRPATARSVAWHARATAVPTALCGRSVTLLAVRAAGGRARREGVSAMAKVRIREGAHAGWTGELIAELSDSQVAYLRIRLGPGRTALLVAERAKLEPEPALPARTAPPPRWS
jgi:uncharacterized iron-regulated membrane protein